MGNNMIFYVWTTWEAILYLAFIFICASLIKSRFNAKKTAIIILAGIVLSAVMTAAVFAPDHNVAVTLKLLPLTAYFPAILVLHILSCYGFFKTAPVWSIGLLAMYLGRLSIKAVILNMPLHSYSPYAAEFLTLFATMSIICFVIFKFIRRPYHHFTRLANTSWFIPLPLMLLIIAILSYFINGSTSPALTVLLFLVVIATFFVIARLFWTEYTKQQLKEKQKEYKARIQIQQKEFMEIAYKHDLLREYRHDMRHHLLALGNILRDSDNTYAEEYIEMLMGRLEDTEKIIYCKNQMINAVLSSYIDMAKKIGCSLDTQISIPEDLNIKDIDLCVVLSNTLENAIHACENEEENHRNIKIKINYHNSLCIEIKNSCSKTIAFGRDGLPVNTSAQEHGIGLKSTANTVEKYNGILKCECKNGQFKLGIIMFNTAEKESLPHTVPVHRVASAILFSVLCICVFLNSSSITADALADVPVVGSIVQIITAKYHRTGWGDDKFFINEPKILLKKPYTLAQKVLRENEKNTDNAELDIIFPAHTILAVTPTDLISIKEASAPPARPSADSTAMPPAEPVSAVPEQETPVSSSNTLAIPPVTPEDNKTEIILPPDTSPKFEDGIEDMNKKLSEYVEILREKYDWYLSHKYMGHVALEVTYDILRNDDEILSIRFDGTLNVGGSQNFSRCFSLDKRTGNVVELADLFQTDADYIMPVSNYILNEMTRRVENNEGIYFVPDGMWPDEDCFKSISEEQNFYINEQGQLVIVFDEYQVAPGNMGMVEFVIPTDVIASILPEFSLLH